jgi:hypothetical protein
VPKDYQMATAVRPAQSKKTPPKKSPKPPPPPSLARKVHPFIKWIRGTGVAGIFLGLSSILLLGWFWAEVAFVYAAAVVIVVDLWFELELPTKWKFVGTAICLASAAAFSWAVVFVQAPLSVAALVTNAEYPPGTTINGVPWKKEFTELEMRIINSTDHNYDDISLLIRPTEPITSIQQVVTNVPGVYFTDKNNFSVKVADVKPFGRALAIPLVLLATDTGYVMHCPRLPARTSIQVLIALADIKWSPPPAPPDRPIQDQVNDKDYVLRIKMDDFSTYWLGHADGNVYVGHPNPQWVKVDGEYTGGFRTRAISKKIDLASLPFDLPFAY